MKIGVYSFPSGSDVAENFTWIKKGIKEAAKKQVRLLVFHECAATGYPPIETPDVARIDYDALQAYTKEVCQLAKQYHMYIGLGSIRIAAEKRYNTMLLIDDNGTVTGHYDKRALWGWDINHFTRGTSKGIFQIDGIKIGFRICFEIRFPEFFRECYLEEADICFVLFSDTAKEALPERYAMLKGHLQTRAVENVMHIISVNSASDIPTAPTAILNGNGSVLAELPMGRQGLLWFDYEKPSLNFGAEGRRVVSDWLLGKTEK